MATQYTKPYANDEKRVFVKTIMRTTTTTTPVTYGVDLPPGHYRLLLTVNSSVTGTTTKIGNAKMYVNPEQTVVATTPLYANLLNSGTLGTINITLSAGTAFGQVANLVANSGVNMGIPVNVPHGLRFTYVKGTANTGEKMIVKLIAHKD